MDYADIEVYSGAKTRCDQCGRAWRRGEVISVASNQDLAFCYSDGDGGCLVGFVMMQGVPLMGEPMRFGPERIPEDEATPSYPNLGMGDGVEVVTIARYPPLPKLPLWKRILRALVP